MYGSSQIHRPLVGAAVSRETPASAALPISAPPRLRVSRSDAHRDGEHAERWRTRCLLSLAGATLPNQTNLCENCYNAQSPLARTCCVTPDGGRCRMSSLTDRHACRSPRGERDGDCGHPTRFNLYENCYILLSFVTVQGGRCSYSVPGEV